MTTTKHTDEDLDQLVARFEEWAQTLKPEDMEDVRDLRAVAEATDALHAAEHRLREAVEVARKLHGRSWGQIAIPLGVSRQAARERWATKVDG
jgi:hypothetical protein